MAELILLVLGLLLGGVVVFLVLRKVGAKAPTASVTSATIADRVRAVGRLVGLEVSAKEIATSTKGWSWMPPILLSQARVAMIFHFEKQYSVDLARVREADVERLGEGRYRLRLPSIEGALRLLDVEPYDIQAGRVLGLLDIIQVNAATQKDLMKHAQGQASELFEKYDARYRSEAKASVERHLTSLLALFGIEVECVWREDTDAPRGDRLMAAGAGRG